MNTSRLERLMEENNRLLREQSEHLISLRALLQTVMVYLPACASGREVDRKAVTRLSTAYATAEGDLRQKQKPKRRRGNRTSH